MTIGVNQQAIHSNSRDAQRPDPGLPPDPGADQRSKIAGADRIRILSYNVLGARQGLSKKHGHVGMDVSREQRCGYSIRNVVRTVGEPWRSSAPVNWPFPER